jgi:hypothetical protein
VIFRLRKPGFNIINYEELAMKKKRKAYEDMLDAQLEEWNEQIVLLKARADKAKVEAMIEYYKTIEALQRRQNKARVNLDNLKIAGDGAWDDLKIGVEKAWAEVKTAFHDASSKFK